MREYEESKRAALKLKVAAESAEGAASAQPASSSGAGSAAPEMDASCATARAEEGQDDDAAATSSGAEPPSSADAGGFCEEVSGIEASGSPVPIWNSRPRTDSVCSNSSSCGDNDLLPLAAAEPTTLATMLERPPLSAALMRLARPPAGETIVRVSAASRRLAQLISSQGKPSRN